MNGKKIEQDLGQIADMLLLNGTLTECPGLVYGKMGIAVFFFHYAQYTDNMLFADYAIDLISELQDQIHINSPADYEKGIAGIGIGLDYLIRNNFLNVEDDICEDFDGRMYRAVLYDPWADFSLYDGLTGYGWYWMSRFRYQASAVQAQKCLWRIAGLIKERLADISDNEQSDVYCFLTELQNLQNLQKISGFDSCTGILEQCRKEWDFQSVDISKCFPRLGDSLTGNIIRMVQRSRYLNVSLQDKIVAALNQIPDLDMEKPPVAMGLLNGYAGEGLLRLTALNQSNTLWMKLL